MQPCERRIGDFDAGVDGRAVEGFLQHVLDALAHSRRVAFARHEYEAREEAPERIATQEEAHALAVLQVEDADCRA
jgi:hypothetical protein